MLNEQQFRTREVHGFTAYLKTSVCGRDKAFSIPQPWFPERCGNGSIIHATIIAQRPPKNKTRVEPLWPARLAEPKDLAAMMRLKRHDCDQQMPWGHARCLHNSMFVHESHGRSVCRLCRLIFCAYQTCLHPGYRIPNIQIPQSSPNNIKQ